MMPLVVFTIVLTPEEVQLLRKNKLQELHYQWLEHIYQSLNHSVSLPI